MFSTLAFVVSSSYDNLASLGQLCNDSDGHAGRGVRG